MSDDERGSAVDSVLAELTWVHRQEDIGDGAGDTTTWGLVGPPNMEAQQVATDKYFGRDREQVTSDDDWTDRELNRRAEAVEYITKEEPVSILTEAPAPPGGPCESDFQVYVSLVYNDAQALLLKKHNDYGPKNISDAPGGALNGLRVRMHDKMARINHLIDSGAQPENEPLMDSFLDLLNYSAIAILVLQGQWPGSDV